MHPPDSVCGFDGRWPAHEVREKPLAGVLAPGCGPPGRPSHDAVGSTSKCQGDEGHDEGVEIEAKMQGPRTRAEAA